METDTQGTAPPETARAPSERPPANRTTAGPVEGPVEPTKPRTAAQRAVPFPIVPVAIAATLIVVGLALGLAAWLGWKWAALVVAGLVVGLWVLRLALRAAWLKKIGRGRQTGARSGPTSGGRGGLASRIFGGRSPRSAASRSGGAAGGRGGILGRRSGSRAGGSAGGRRGGILSGIAGGRRRSAAGGTGGTRTGTSGRGAGGSAGGGRWPFGRGRSGGRTGRRGGLFGGGSGGGSTGRSGRGRPGSSGGPRTPASGVHPGRTAGPSVASGTLDEVKAGLGKLRDWLDNTEWDGFSVGGRRDRPKGSGEGSDGLSVDELLAGRKPQVKPEQRGHNMRSGGTASAGETSLYGFVEKVLPEVPKLINEFAAEIQRVADAARDDQVVSAALTERIEAAVRTIKAVATDAEGWRGQARREQEADIDRVERPRKGATPEGRADSQRGRQDM